MLYIHILAAAPASSNLSYIHSSNRSASFAPSPRGAMGNALISSGNGRDNRMNNNVFLKSFKSAVLKTLQKSFVSEDSHVNDSYIQSGADLQGLKPPPYYSDKCIHSCLIGTYALLT